MFTAGTPCSISQFMSNESILYLKTSGYKHVFSFIKCSYITAQMYFDVSLYACLIIETDL